MKHYQKDYFRVLMYYYDTFPSVETDNFASNIMQIQKVMQKLNWLLTLSLFILIGCKTINTKPSDLITDNIAVIVGQQSLQTDIIEDSDKFLNPRTIDKKGNILYVPKHDWTSGFFAGSMWYTYELTKDNKWIDLAVKYTNQLDSVKYITDQHDIGFMIGCSYINGYRIEKKQSYKAVIIEAAKSLSTRFRPNAGVIQSWDINRGWQAKRGWECPVIIDNMMNLELLFEATKLSGDSSFYKIAVSHANKTLENHFRANNSCYHVVDYDPITGEVRKKETAQGYADESSWARGQAWALYGFTICYRYTSDPKYIDQAKKIYDFIFTEKNLPPDLIPYWDYDAPNIPKEPRDVSSAAITASALYEMSTFLNDCKYKETADKIMEVLSTPEYRAEIGTNGNFVLKHSVGSIPHNNEIDVPLNYADYYFIEALVRKLNLKNNEKALLTLTKI
jgi:rhamnogalacturonyl hydrolase YesR